MKSAESLAKKPPLKKDSYSLQTAASKVQPGYLRNRILAEPSRRDDSFSSYKGLSPTSNRSNNSSRNSSRESSRGRERSIGSRPKSLTKNTSVSSLKDDPSGGSKITTFEKEIIRKGIKVPAVTSKAWVVANGDSGEVIFGRREASKREIASLTKIMTCFCACKLILSYGIDAKETYVQVSQNASGIIGTTANLKQGDIISIWDLLHGLMLPSGNDAAYCIAESFGTYINMQSEDYKAKVKANPSHAQYRGKFALKYFLQFMNQTAFELGLSNTKYSNPHGLCDRNNRSTAADIAKLTANAMKNELFRQIVVQQKYSCLIEQIDETERQATWENTNKLLPEGWDGVKTGITTAAGPCFSGFVKIEGKNYIVVVLSCESMEARWGECNRLVNWVHEHSKLQSNF